MTFLLPANLPVNGHDSAVPAELGSNTGDMLRNTIYPIVKWRRIRMIAFCSRPQNRGSEWRWAETRGTFHMKRRITAIALSAALGFAPVAAMAATSQTTTSTQDQGALPPGPAAGVQTAQMSGWGPNTYMLVGGIVAAAVIIAVVSGGNGHHHSSTSSTTGTP
jgi:hypothetical protein